MECRDVRPLIDAFLTEQLQVETMEGVVAHLTRCSACRAEVTGVARLRAATRAAFANAPGLRARRASRPPSASVSGGDSGPRGASRRWLRRLLMTIDSVHAD